MGGRRICTLAMLVAFCGIIFGVGAAFGQRGKVRVAPSYQVVFRFQSHRLAGRPGRRAAVRAFRVHSARRELLGAFRPKRHPAGDAVVRLFRSNRPAGRAARRRTRINQFRPARHAQLVRAVWRKGIGASPMPPDALQGIHAWSGDSAVALARVGSGIASAAPAGSLRASAAGVANAAVRMPEPGFVAAPALPRAHPAAKGSSGGTSAPTDSGFPFGLPQPSEVEHIVGVIPSSIWIAFASALALAAIGGSAAVRSGRRARLQAEQFAAVTAAAMTDPLTGVLNRRGFADSVERELARSQRHDRPFVLAYIDIRGLKNVNDTEGHLVGDELIRQVASLLEESGRANDVVGRLGGDELGMLLAEQSADRAAMVVQRIQDRLPERHAAIGVGVPWDLTIGTAAYPEDGETLDELLAAADRRLYEQRGIQLR